MRYTGPRTAGCPGGSAPAKLEGANRLGGWRGDASRVAGEDTSSGNEPSGLTADKLLLKKGLILSYVESVAGELELGALLDRLLYHACDLIDADDGTIGLVETDKGVMRIAAEYQMQTWEMGAVYGRGRTRR